MEVQCCFTDTLGLLAMTISDNGESIAKESAGMEVVAKKGNYRGVDSMVFKILLGRCFWRRLAKTRQVSSLKRLSHGCLFLSHLIHRKKCA